MNPMNSQSAEHSASLWLNNLVNGASGLAVKVKAVLYCDASPFQKIEVFDTYSFGTVLSLGGTIVLTERDEHVYHEMIVHPAMLMHPKPTYVCIIGGGDGGCVREVLRHPCVERVVAVDIDKMVTQTVERFFPHLAPGLTDARVAPVVQDGLDFLEKCGDRFDVIVVDSFAPGGPTATLETLRFYEEVAAHLTDNGIAVVQTDSPVLKPNVLRKVHNDMSSLFAGVKPYFCMQPSFPDGICSFVVSAMAEDGLDLFDKQRYAAIAPKCSYYNDAVHKGAFLLPEHIRKVAE